MAGVVRTDSKISAGACHGLEGSAKDFGHSGHVTIAEIRHGGGHGNGIHGDAWMVMRTQIIERLLADGAVTKRRALRAAGNNPNMLHLSLVLDWWC